MRQRFTILIADRNPHVREFLKREMTAEGYQIQLAKNAREVLKWVYNPIDLDLLILDLELPDSSESSILEKLKDRIPPLPLVIHTFPSDDVSYPTVSDTVVFVEKQGTNIDRLKETVIELLQKFYPRRFDQGRD